MDRISCLAYLLYQENNDEIKDAALQLVRGDISIKQLKKNSFFLPYIQEAEKQLKHIDLYKNEVCRFAEEHLFVF